MIFSLNRDESRAGRDKKVVDKRRPMSNQAGTFNSERN